MATVEASIQAALFARAASLVLNPVHEIAWPNVSFPGLLPNGQPRPKPSKYLRVSHLPNVTQRLLISSTGKQRHQGILQILVVSPLNTGEATPREIAGLVASHFATDLRLTIPQGSVRITKRPNVAAALITDTEIQIPVSISYECFA